MESGVMSSITSGSHNVAEPAYQTAAMR